MHPGNWGKIKILCKVTISKTELRRNTANIVFLKTNVSYYLVKYFNSNPLKAANQNRIVHLLKVWLY